MTSRNAFMKSFILSPIPSMASETTLHTRTSSCEALLPSTSNTFSLRDMEENSLSSIDLESLVLFPDSEINLELHIPTDKAIPKRSSAFIEHLPLRRHPDQRKQHRMSLKLRSVVNQVHKKLGYTKKQKIMCGTNEAGYESDSDSDSDFGISGNFAELASSTPSQSNSHHISPSNQDTSYASSFYNPHAVDLRYKRQAIYGSDVSSPDFPFSMNSSPPISQSHNRASVYSPARNGPSYQITPDSSPSIEYQRRRKSAFASLG